MIEKNYFGKTKNGEAVDCYKITNSKGESVELITYGAAVRSLFIEDKNGKLRDVVLGYDCIEDYQNNGGRMGAVMGRIANRVFGPSFTLNGKTYNLYPNSGDKVSIHGGKISFDKKVWKAEAQEDGLSVKFTLFSPDGEENYPGNLTLSVTYTFSEKSELILEYNAISDKDTPFNFTNHTYFNLDGQDCRHDCLATLVRINSEEITPMNEYRVPDGTYRKVFDTPFDFTEFKEISEDIYALSDQLDLGSGYDINYVLNDCLIAAEAKSEASGILLKTYTDLPGMQFYSGNGIKQIKGKNGAQYDKRWGFCFETQFFPNAINTPQFHKPILKAGEKFVSRTTYAFEHIDEN